MFGRIINQIQVQHGDDVVIGVYLSLIGEIQKTYIKQQKELDQIKKDYAKIEKERLNKKKERKWIYIF